MKNTGTAHESEIAKTIGELVAEDYRTAGVFEKYGIDFCCGGKVVLSDICREKGLDPVLILEDLEQVKETPSERGQNYGAWELSFLADYIVNTHHAWLRENMGVIADYARKVAGVHGANHPEVVEIAGIFDTIVSDMFEHLRQEEEVFFPAVRRIEAARKSGAEPAKNDLDTIRGSLERLDEEHNAIGEAVHTIRRLSREYEIPADACNTYMVTYRKLKEFEDDLHKHVHLENNILFLKAAKI